MQHNTNIKQEVMHSCLQSALELAIDFVLIQEPWIAFDNNSVAYTITHPSYYCILPSTSHNIRPRVAIYARKQTNYQFCHRTDLTQDSDIIIIDVSGSNIETFQIINIYNEKSLNSELNNSYTVERSLQNIQLSHENETLISEDFNAHHSWWNSSITNSIRAHSLVTWLSSYDCELVNEPDITTCNRSANSIIDLSFATQKLYHQISDWHIDESHASDSDHEVIIFYIRTATTELINNSLCSEHFNLKKADWKLFSEKLVLQAQNIDFSHLHSIHSIQSKSDLNALNTAALQLQNIIYAAAEKSISKTRYSEKSKPWWSDKLSELRKKLSHFKRIWKRNQSHDLYLQPYLNARNQYFQEIKLAKQTHWNEFLKNADSEQVWKAYKYCKQKRIEKASIIQYNERNLTIFAEKSEAFLAALLSANSANNITASINLASYTDNHSESHSNIDDNQ